MALLAVLVPVAWALTHWGSSLAYLAGAPDEVPAAPRRLPGGALVICGGGRVPDKVRDRFVELAGGPEARILVIPTAHTYADAPATAERLLEPWRARNIASVRLLHARSRREADDPNFVKPLTEATGVWISGGVQARLTGVYLGTEFERQLKALLGRGGVIGGTSAGAAVMTRVMITSGRTEAKLGEGFGFLQGAVVDQHFLKRNRMKRLQGVIRRRPDLVGLGIDEQTALVVDVRNHRLNVIGNSYVIACVAEPFTPRSQGSGAGATTVLASANGPAIGHEPAPAPASAPPPAAEGESSPTTRVEILKPGDEADLGALKAMIANAVIPGIDLDAL